MRKLLCRKKGLPMKVLNLLTSGSAGGIESLCRDIGVNSKFENAFCFVFRGGAICDQMTELGLKTYCLEHCGKKFSIKRFLKLRDIAKEYDIIVVHHGDPFLKTYHYLLKKTLKRKYVTFVHSCYEKEYFYPDNMLKRVFAHYVFQKGLDNSDLVIYVSKAGLKSYREEFDIKTNKSVVIYNGIGVNKLNEGRNWKPLKKDTYNIVYVGRLERVKGVDLLLKAVDEVKEKYPIKVSIVGDGTEKESLKKLAEQLGISDITTFYGQQKEVIPFLKMASIFVYPSICQEIFGISIVEAMAFGIPCISNAVGGIPEIIENGKSGFLCETISSENLAEKLDKVLYLIQNSDIDSIVTQAKKRAEDFSIEKTVDNLYKEYNKLICH